ncbi:MAG: hypothetical protein GY925_01060 [Actinomycetia bacterium]|nr:hypothetical protein [Actinomycetes bacterium]
MTDPFLVNIIALVLLGLIFWAGRISTRSWGVAICVVSATVISVGAIVP